MMNNVTMEKRRTYGLYKFVGIFIMFMNGTTAYAMKSIDVNAIAK